MAEPEKNPVATANPPSVMKERVVKFWISLKETVMDENDVVAKTSEFEKRLQAGQVNLLNPEESRQRLSALLKTQKQTLESFASFAPKPK